ncbi:MAG: M56 family metallopeptidase, partial [Nitrospirota bacterium]
LCVNEPYCYIFSLIPEFPMFNGAVIAAVALVILSMLYSIMSLVAYFRRRSVIGKLSSEAPTLTPSTSLSTGLPLSLREREFNGAGLNIKVIDTPLMISFVWGYMSNFIVISTGVLKSLSPDELRCLFAHEISHFRRRDNILKGILLLCRNTLFVFPHVYYLFRWWRETIELIGDEAAVLSTGKPLDVASAILKMQNKSASERDWNIEQFATGFSATAHTETLTKRVERLVAINDSKLVPGNARCSFIPSETGLFAFLTVMFPILFAAIYEIDPLMLHCYLEKITSLL